MTADEARRLTISNYPPERLTEYYELKELIKKKCENPKGPAFQVRVKGELKDVTKLAIEIDGFRHWYDESEMLTVVSWLHDLSFYKNSRVERGIKDLIEYLDKTRSRQIPLEENDKN